MRSVLGSQEAFLSSGDKLSQNLTVSLSAQDWQQQLQIPVAESATPFHSIDRVLVALSGKQKAGQIPSGIRIDCISNDRGEISWYEWLHYWPENLPLSFDDAKDVFRSFSVAVGSLSLSDLVVLDTQWRGQQIPVERYGIIPVLPLLASGYYQTMDSVEPEYVARPLGVKFRYIDDYDTNRDGGTNDGRGAPYLDAALGIGLTCDETLAAVCAGGYTNEGRMLVQMQDVSSWVPPENASARVRRKYRFLGPLYGGLDWKATLVRCWDVATQLSPFCANEVHTCQDDRLLIKGAINNIWTINDLAAKQGKRHAVMGSTMNIVDMDRFDRFRRTYDGTAVRLDGQIDDRNNYRLPLAR